MYIQDAHLGIAHGNESNFGVKEVFPSLDVHVFAHVNLNANSTASPNT